MKQETRECIRLTDSRLVLRGPWVQNRYGFNNDTIEIGIYVISQSMLEIGEKWGDVLAILQVKIPDSMNGANLPKVEIATNTKLWTKELIVAVEQVLRESCQIKGNEYGKLVVGDKGPHYKRTIEYAIKKLEIAFQNELELVLEDGRRLVGDLESDMNNCFEETLHVWGNVKDPATQRSERLLVFTAKDLHPFLWPGASKKPSWTKNKEIWCKKLELVVVSYLNLLASFASHPLNEQIAAIARNLSINSEWSVICHKVLQHLLSLPPESREDERIAKAFKLIEQVS